MSVLLSRTIVSALYARFFALMAKSIDTPVLIIWGKQGQIMNVKVSGKLKNLLKNSVLPIILEMVGYMPILDVEQLTVQAYLKFLKKVKS